MQTLNIPNSMNSKNVALSTRATPELSPSRLLWDWHSAPTQYAPRADVLETKDNLVVRLEMPGFRSDDIDVSLNQDVLTISAERVAPEAMAGELFHRSELSYGTFTRSFKLRSRIRRDDIEASYESGVLQITLPKAEEAKPKSIKVKTS